MVCADLDVDFLGLLARLLLDEASHLLDLHHVSPVNHVVWCGVVWCGVVRCGVV